MEKWTTGEFGTSHEGTVGVVLVDGSEPGPVYVDMGSGSYVPSTTHWTIYDGEFRRPRAAALRGACSCGWRRTTRYPIDWSTIGDTSLDEADIDTDPVLTDWQEHLADVEARAVPLPEDVQHLLEALEGRLDKLAYDAPLAALRIAATLEGAVQRAGRVAACIAASEERHSWEHTATALGLTEQHAQSRLRRYGLRSR
ncbi:hypothetical protein [Streptomyces sp. PR69]|uniref:hypothetical protein n=1 Tax=Streptomyces sp. PR69 TaxID=2984950 RepID=UPI0022651126|nr:hypothetical protein [Streptomyces sp. PR69]